MLEAPVALRCSSIAKRFDELMILDNVSLSVEPGQVMALVGGNGSGKTTLLNVVNGFAPADRGTVFLGSTEVTHFRAHKIARYGVGRLFQDFVLVEGATAIENVMVGVAGASNERIFAALHPRFRFRDAGLRERAMQLLARVGIAEHANRDARKLSYGQQKLVALAACIATGSKLVLLDEPAAGIATSLRSTVMTCIRSLALEGRAVLLIEHDRTVVTSVADSICVLERGTITRRGKAADVL